jgi:4-hydroxybenzoate polyprenyltransferase
MRSAFVHLRLQFQLLLAPIFLWAWLLSGGGWSWRIAVAFVALHVFLYGGTTAFNSYFDRDRGPVGGLAKPPPVSSQLLPFSLAMKGIGGLLAWVVDPLFFWIYAAFVVLSLAYSHPRVRLKARPVLSVVVVGFGQGILAFLGAWVANRGELASVLSRDGILGVSAATLVVVGLYPLTQLFQVEEDRGRGDRTIAVAWGPHASFRLSLACLLAGGLLLALVVLLRFGAADALVVGLGLMVQLLAILWWARRYDPAPVMANYRRVMRLNASCSAGLALYLCFRLVNP